MGLVVEKHKGFFFFLFLLLLLSRSFGLAVAAEYCEAPPPARPPAEVTPEDADKLQFALNLEHLEADFFLHGALGVGLDHVAPELVMGGPPPVGARKAELDRLTRSIITEFAYEEVGHLRAIKSTVGGFPRPAMDLSAENFGRIFEGATGLESEDGHQFDPYANSLNYLLASYILPYMGILGYVGANPDITGFATRRLLAGLLAVEAGQDAVIRGLLYQRAEEEVPEFGGATAGEVTYRISELRDKLAGCGRKDEGVRVSLEDGAEGKTRTNVLSADGDSVAYHRTPAEILRVLYGTGDEHLPGGFLPEGGNGTIARAFLV